MTKLWQKSSANTLHPLIEAYTVDKDKTLDLVFMPYDIQASHVHAKALKQCGILSAKEFRAIKIGLNQLMKQWKAGKVHIKMADEDCHTVIENHLIKQCGYVGKKIHTGRSRNDQSLVAQRLYLKDNLNGLHKNVKNLAQAFLRQAKKYQIVPLPGYTHGQQAMLSSVGHYYCSFTESLLDDFDLLKAVAELIDKNPLGSAAGFGSSFSIDRVTAAKNLSFKKIQVNSLYCQSGRGKYESLYLEALVQVMLTLNRFAHDIILFTSQEYDFFKVADDLVTGSSIMPQKRNLDGLEILRGQLSCLISHQHRVQDISKNLLSGYNRDYQLLKESLIEATTITYKSIAVAKLYLLGLTPNQTTIIAKINPKIFSADIANRLVQTKNIPFRDAYRMSMEQLNDEPIDLAKNIASKVSLGSPGNLDLKNYEERLRK